MKKAAKFAIPILFSCALAVLTLIFIFPFALSSFDIDGCLDAGGHWNAVSRECEEVYGDYEKPSDRIGLNLMLGTILLAGVGGAGYLLRLLLNAPQKQVDDQHVQ